MSIMDSLRKKHAAAHNYHGIVQTWEWPFKDLSLDRSLQIYPNQQFSFTTEMGERVAHCLKLTEFL